MEAVTLSASGCVLRNPGYFGCKNGASSRRTSGLGSIQPFEIDDQILKAFARSICAQPWNTLCVVKMTILSPSADKLSALKETTLTAALFLTCSFAVSIFSLPTIIVVRVGRLMTTLLMRP